MMALFTGKTSGYLVDKKSFYAPGQLWYRLASKAGICADLVRVMTALNDVEDWIGISRTTWTSTLGSPASSQFPHYSVRVGGDAANCATFREAIDRVRLNGGASAWDWKFARTKNQNALLSAIIVFEYFLAIGRIVGGGYGNVARTYITVSHHPYGYLIDQESYGDYYQLNGGGRFSLVAPGERLNENIFDFANYWVTKGSIDRSQWLSRTSGTDPRDEDLSPTDHSRYTINEPGLRVPTQTDIDRNHSTTEAAALLTMPIYMGVESSGLNDSLEALEEAHPDKWNYIDKSDDGDYYGDFSLTNPESSVDISYIAGVVTTQGTAKFREGYTFDPTTPFFEYYGDYEQEQTVSGMEAAPQSVDQPSTGFNLTEVWATADNYTARIAPDGPGYVNLNSPLWKHNEANRVNVPYTTFPEPAPEAFHGLRLRSGYRTEGTPIGTGVWRTSHVSPFTGTGYPYDSDDPNDEKTTEEVLEILLSRLRGIAGEGGGPGGSAVFDPITQDPQKYFWCFPSFPFASGDGAIPDLASALRPNANDQLDGVPSSCRAAWTAARNIHGWDPDRDSLSRGELNYSQVFAADCLAEGYIKADRTADIRFPSTSGSRGRWLVWDSYGTNGDSPFEEVVNRF